MDIVTKCHLLPPPGCYTARMFTYRVRYRQITIETITVLTITIEPLCPDDTKETQATLVYQLTSVHTVPPASPSTASPQPTPAVGE